MKQRWPFPWGTVAAILSMCLAIGSQLREIGFVVFPADVASMHLSNEKQPLLLGKRLDVQRAVRVFAAPGPSEAERPSAATESPGTDLLHVGNRRELIVTINQPTAKKIAPGNACLIVR